MVTRFPTTVATRFTNNDKSIDYDTAWWFRCITPKATRALVAIIINIFAFVIAAVALYDTTYYISKRWELEQRISVIDRRKEELWFPTAGGGRGWGYRTKLTTKTPSTLEKAASGILQQYLPPCCLSIHTILRTFSSCPAIYWFLSDLLLVHTENKNAFNVRKGSIWYSAAISPSLLIYSYFALYNILGVIMHVNWLPWI